MGGDDDDDDDDDDDICDQFLQVFLGKISTQPHTLIMFSVCDSNPLSVLGIGLV